jgi:pimeloyl-ACP methyl ester carboxylesterase
MKGVRANKMNPYTPAQLNSMPYFKTSDGCPIFFEHRNLSSPKPVIVFLNGATQTTVYWTTIANRLKNDFQILAYDARAQGRSDPGKRPLSLDLHSADLCNLLEYVGVDKVRLVGLSHGSSIALAFTSRFPYRVDRLMLCSVTAEPTCRARLTVASWLRTLKQEGIEAMAWAALPVVFGENFLRKNEGVLDKIIKAIVRRNKEDGLIAQLEAMAEFTPLSSAALDIRCPVLVLSASDDPLVTEEGAQELARICKGRHERLPGLGHSIPAEAPELFVDILKRFLV